MAKEQKTVTLNLFNCVKRLIDSGAPVSEIVEYMQISPTTVNRIKRAESLEEYKNMTYTSVRAAKASEKKQEQTAQEDPKPQTVRHEQSVTIVANHYMAEELRKQTQALELISNKMTHIYEILEDMREIWK